jgi:hypothetical protein
VPILRTIEVSPSSGPVGGRWAEPDGVDSFAKSARSVCELYYDALKPVGIDYWTSKLTLELSDHRDPGR